MEISGSGIENGYKIPNLRFTGFMCKTNIASNTSFRGFGNPQAVAAMEEVIFNIAFELNISQEKVSPLRNSFSELNDSMNTAIMNIVGS